MNRETGGSHASEAGKGATDPKGIPHSSHWGAFRALTENGRLTEVRGFEHDPSPSPLLASMPDWVASASRVGRPMIRRGWLEHGPGVHTDRRGRDAFVAVGWDEAIDRVAAELDRVRRNHGNEAIFGGSYGWSSAGRFHHAKSQLRRFLSQLGGFTDQRFSYSNAAGHAILPYIFGIKGLGYGPYTSWSSIAEHADLFVSFGGLGVKNTQVEPGGMGEHVTHKWFEPLATGKTRFVSITPIRDDTAGILDAEWIAPRPNTDVAIMLAIAHTLITEELHDEAFLARYCTGFDEFRAYVLGETDAVSKTPAWAEQISQVSAARIVELARQMAAGRTMIGVAYALQRADHGEQAYWAAAALAGMLGQIGKPGGGCGFGYGSMNGYGASPAGFASPTFPTGQNPVDSYIPVARIADMLLSPGGPYTFCGEDRTYPDIKLVYWCGGNPFHHHQDLNRLIEAWRRPETIIVNEISWTATAWHSDIVLPATTTLERNDIGASRRDRFVMAMQRVVAPVAESRNDHDIFADLAGALGFRERFTEGRSEMDWLRHLYEVARQQPAADGSSMPPFDEFWDSGHIEFEESKEPFVQFADFFADPDGSPLPTPSGKVEIFSETIAGYGYADCPGHPAWMPPREWLGAELAARFPLHLISNQPNARLHSQMDDAQVSRNSKIAGREPATLNPKDARSRGIRDGDVIRLFNDRGALLAGARLSESVREGVVQLATGAWYDPEERGRVGSLDKHGNPNVLTSDHGTSSLTQGPAAHSVLIEVERFEGAAPPVTAFASPVQVER